MEGAVFPNIFTFSFSLFLSIHSLPHCVKQKLKSGETPKARATSQRQRDSSGDSPPADLAGPCTGKVPLTSEDSDWAWMGCWKLLLTPYFWIACSYSECRWQRKTVNTANCQKLFVASAYLFLSWIAFIFPFLIALLTLPRFSQPFLHTSLESLHSAQWQYHRDSIFLLLASCLIDLPAYLAAMMPGPVWVLTEAKLGVAGKQTGMIPCQNSGVMTHQLAHMPPDTLQRWRAPSGTWKIEKTSSWACLASWGMLSSRKKYIITTTNFLFTEISECIWPCLWSALRPLE